MPLPARDDHRELLSPPVKADGVALFLDMDGVLAPLAPTPDAVLPSLRRTRILRALEQRLAGRVAIISGRTILEIDRISGTALKTVSGVHGLERRLSDGRIERQPANSKISHVLDVFLAFAAPREGMIVENKGVAVGLHFQQTPEHADAAWALARSLEQDTGLVLQPGHMVLELKTAGATKGTALTAFMQEQPFAGAVPVMLGDDLTDEHAFEAAVELGGYGVLVGPMRETAAAYRLEDVDGVLSWLEAVATLEAPA